MGQTPTEGRPLRIGIARFVLRQKIHVPRGAIFLGYHARAGTARGFLAHTGSGAVKGLW